MQTLFIIIIMGVVIIHSPSSWPRRLPRCHSKSVPTGGVEPLEVSLSVPAGCIRNWRSSVSAILLALQTAPKAVSEVCVEVVILIRGPDAQMV